jgi:hypothetical protein
MADIKATSLGGVPKGTTANRPTSPAVGDVFYNGTLGCLEIYTSQGWVANSAPPGIPTIGTATYSATNKAYNNSSASVVFTPGEGGGLPNLYRATSTPGGYSGTATSSPITVEGLQSATAYTFSVTGTNNFGTSAGSTNSNSITVNTVPQIPGTPVAAFASGTSATLTFTPGATGGAAITNYKYSTDGINYTTLSPAQTTSPISITGLTAGQNYTFYLKAVNTNGDSTASLASNSIYIGYANLTGGTLTSDATYYYRTFTASGNLVVADTNLESSILVLAGGGAGGFSVGGGGGAGGLVNFASQTLSPGTYSCAVGGGGAAGTQASQIGGQGVNSSFGSLTPVSVGGGGGNQFGSSFDVRQNGGSGGGAGGQNSGTVSGGTPVSDQGFAGGTGQVVTSPSQRPSGGGGGAGGAGANGSGNNSGAGGIGSNSYSSWLTGISSGMSGVSGWVSATSGGRIAGGGGGGANTDGNNSQGAGGAGGGGAGGFGSTLSSQTGTNGIANTGSGGGGACSGVTGANGGTGNSGIIIIRYTKASVGV